VDGLQQDEMARTPGAALVYPILFCYRHYLELRIKQLIFYVVAMQNALAQIDAATAARKEEDVYGKHGLKALWNMLQHLDAKIDLWATGSQRKGLLRLLDELDRQDPVAQAARYPIDSKGNQTLTGLSIVDMGNVKTAVHKVARYLETTEYHLIEVEPDYC